jgi:trehalose 6-phosphate synthase/phosphatase
MTKLRILHGEDNQVTTVKQQSLFEKLGSQRLLVVSNRLPVSIDQGEAGWEIKPGTGGLVTAIAPIMRKNRGLWVGWPGSAADIPYEELLGQFSQFQGYELKPVEITQEEIEKYYYGFSNATIWPLFHDLLGYCKFDKDEWFTYKEVNRKFAEVIAGSVTRDDFIWIHDYHLTLVGHYLRRKNLSAYLTYFLHIPFPAYDLFRRLPWRAEILHGMLAYDLLGFQTLRDRRNFINCVRNIIPGVKVVAKRRYSIIHHDSRTIRVGNFPISIDFDEFNQLAKTKEVADEAWIFHEQLGSKRIILGVDRLDYTKGIPERLLAFERALEKYPDLHNNLVLFQLLIPSRTPVPEYQHLKDQLDTLVGRINGRFSTPGWTPIHYMFRTLDRVHLLGVYKACEIALITPLRDGMNLVAKEYCASSIDNEGVLILSEFAGAAEQLRTGALIVNPYDIDRTAETIYRAFTMPIGERKARMAKLRMDIRRSDVHTWVRWFVESCRESTSAIRKRRDRDAESPAETPAVDSENATP